MRFRHIFFVLAVLFLLFRASSAEEEAVYVLTDENGQKITSRLGRMYAGDEYISEDNLLYEVVWVNDGTHTARARLVGEEAPSAQAAFSALAQEKNDLILMYSTHSDESYIPGDGDYSLVKNAGIYDVGAELQKHLEALGYTVEYSRETFLPHDAGAYRRSRAVAAEYAKRMPLAILDIHRDGIDADEYETTVEGRDMSKVRLFVGKSNANSAENRAFAKKLKAIADDRYPGLVKDIYIGKGNYNQDLYPNAILLEMGTHKIDKQLVMNSTEYLANVLDSALGGKSTPSEKTEEQKGAADGVKWLLLFGIGAAVIFAIVAAGSLRGGAGKIKDGFREITGGIFSKSKKKE